MTGTSPAGVGVAAAEGKGLRRETIDPQARSGEARGPHGLFPVSARIGALGVLGLAALTCLPGLPATAAEAAVSAAPCAASGSPQAPRISVEVTGARSDAGNITITLYGPDSSRFLAPGGKLARVRVPVRGGRSEACFTISAPAEFAIAVYHDENNDHDFNRTLLGMPKEGYGFSNNIQAVLGLPSFDAVRFKVGPEGASQPITLRY